MQVVTPSCRRHHKKGCDFGFALAANSCERVSGVDATTVTALGAITAFAGSEPRRSSCDAVGFFGSGRPTGRPVGPDHPAYFRSANAKFANPFLPSTGAVTSDML